MDDQAPTTPTPDPHRAEPLPEPQEGARPGTEQAVRPEQDEPNGPLGGLVSAGAADVEQEAADVAGTDDPEAEALLAQMGVEEENIASGQLLGLVAATLISVLVLGAVLVYIFYQPYRAEVGAREAGEADNVDVQILEAEALTKINTYTRTDATYGLPISRAMGLVVAEYGTGDATGLPASDQEWNMLAVTRGMGAAVQNTPQRGEVVGGAIPADALPMGDGDEEVGVDDESVDTIEAIAPDADPETIE